jgi:hypothetical protein
MRAIYKNWLRIMLTEKNPYTGIALKDESGAGYIAIAERRQSFVLDVRHHVRTLKSASLELNTARG